MRWLTILLLAGSIEAFSIQSGFALTAEQALTQPPQNYCNDYANLLKPATVAEIDNQLRQFERDTSNQIVVVIFPSLPPNGVIEDYAQTLYREMKLGQKGTDNGALLLVFVNDRKIRIHTGRGLEGALPDAICKRIIAEQIAPRFKTGDFDGGIQVGVASMIAATKGEYKGTGQTVAERKAKTTASDGGAFEVILFIIIFLIIAFVFFRRGVFFSGGPWIGGGGGFSGGGGGGFSGGGGGDSGGFSGGGGDSGGGGASGDW